MITKDKVMGQEEQIKAIKAMLGKLDTMLAFDEGIAVDSVSEIKDKFNEYVKEKFQNTKKEEK